MKLQQLTTYHDNGLVAGTYEVVDGTYNGKFELFLKNGKKYSEGFYLDGKLHGKVTKFLNDKIKQTIDYVNGEFNGKIVNFDTSSCRIINEWSYKNNKLHGECFCYHPNGKLESVSNYKDGLLDGSYSSWFINDQKECVCNYSNGKINGRYQEWFDDGNLRFDVIYENGILKDDESNKMKPFNI